MMNTQALPRAQKRLLEYLIAYKREHNGNSPSIPTMAKELGITKTPVWNTLIRLQEAGYIRRSYFDTDIEIPGSHWEME